MSKYKIVNDGIIEWAANYKGPKFHAIFCDPPYGMSKKKKIDFNASANIDPNATIADIIDAYHNVQQWGNAGFMNKTWDNDIAFNPETWKALARHLLPGGFGMVFASARGWHRLAVAIEDAGLRIFPSIFGWVYGSGFPKATRLDKKIDEMAGIEQMAVGKHLCPARNKTGGSSLIMSVTGMPQDVNITVPSTGLAKTWAGHRYGLQALKPALEPIICFQKPYEGKPIDCIVETGAGAFDIDGGRITNSKKCHPMETQIKTSSVYLQNGCHADTTKLKPSGRWPANFYVQHSPSCKEIGKKGIDEWECAEECPVKLMGEHGTITTASRSNNNDNRYNPQVYAGSGYWGNHGPDNSYNDKGTASRFFHNSDWTNETLEQLKNTDPAYYCPKSSRKERDAGLNDSPTLTRNRVNPGGLENDPKFAPVKAKNIHPTVKPTTLCKWIATLLLPPQEYQPRRILIPFSGSGSEMIGSLLAGWDEIVGVEVTNTPEEPYCDIAESRLKFWQEQSKKGTREPKEILKNNNKLKKSKSKKETSTKAIQLSLLENRNKKE